VRCPFGFCKNARKIFRKIWFIKIVDFKETVYLATYLPPTTVQETISKTLYDTLQRAGLKSNIVQIISTFSVYDKNDK